MLDLKARLDLHPVGTEWEFGVLTFVESATRGWAAAAELCRKKFDDFPESANSWRWKAVVFAYVNDLEWYQKAAARAIALAPVATNWDDRMDIMQAAARGPFQFSLEQSNHCEALMAAVRQAVPSATKQQKQQATRGLAALQLRFGQFSEALTNLDQALEFAGNINRPNTLLLKAICLHALGRAEEARATLRDGEAETQKYLPEPVSVYEGYLNEPERYCLLLRKEARTRIGPD